MRQRLLVLGLIAAALAASWLIHRLVERPVSRIMRQRLTRAPAPPGIAIGEKRLALPVAPAGGEEGDNGA